jgi:xylose isomerase
MRTYLILKAKAQQFAEDREIQALIAQIRGQGEAFPPYSRAAADRVKARAFDRAALSSRPLPYERLDQLLVDLLFGVR